MEDGSVANPSNRAAIDAVVACARSSAREGAADTEAFLRCYFGHVSGSDLNERDVEDLFGMAADHARLGLDWASGSTAISVVNPRVEVHGWHSDHTVVMIVTDDLPFLVDSVAMELSRLQLGIHLVVHPVLLDLRSEDLAFANPREHRHSEARKCSFMAVEVDRQANPDQLELIEADLRRVLGDVRAAVEDWEPMRDRMREIAARLDDEPSPLLEADLLEGRDLLEWLADDHLIFLGYREYRLDGHNLVTDLASGLGILRSDGTEPLPVRNLSHMAPQVQARAREQRLLNLTKASSRSTVHRASYMDYIGIKRFDEAGEVIGEQRFLGLYTSELYTRSVTRLPRVQRLVAEVLARAAYPPGGHDEKRLLNILEGYPRDELLQIEVDELFDIAVAIAGLQERRRVRVFGRPELFERFVTCMVYMPRDRYNTAARAGIQDLLVEAYGGSSAEWSTQISESVLARTLFHIRIESGRVRQANLEDVEAQISLLLQDWHDDFNDELIRELGEDRGVLLGRRYRSAFPPAYRESFTPRSAVADVQQLEALVADGQLGLSVYREPGQPRTAFKLKLYRSGERVSLTSVMPTLTNLGVTVMHERPYEVTPEDRDGIWIYDFSLEHPDEDLDFGEVSSLFEEAFSAVWHGEVADNGFNRLVICAGLAHRDIAILHAYARYLRQTGAPYSRDYIERTLTQHAEAARLLVELFVTRLDPSQADREKSSDAVSTAFFAIVDEVTSLDQDRILRRFHNLVQSTLRTNYFQRTSTGEVFSYLAFKLDPTSIQDLPEPRPQYEIFVYSPRFEGVHMRAGSVARGGLRWSDRNEDYRTEVLGLVKAQMVKNAVIVPAGAKGGFVLKRAPSDQAALRDEVVACYKLFVSALLDLTDNIIDGEIVAPEQTVRHDGDDTYLVVAADKGTATFSDIANELAIERNFWLGDAFASGGSNGYDHKAMGITARGAWESVKQHFRELGRDIQTDAFTAVGIGDMSGDVFGNGMLLSAHTRLVAAFDHRHVFVDPDPDAQVAFAERARLFKLPRSSWADYDQALISQGGGIYPRSAKSIKLTAEACTALGMDTDTVTPDELINAVLRAPVDLLWNGGIGTYVKASDESHSAVGDKANDTIRVDGCDLRVAVVGEGGNLGVTQLGRIEFARNEGRIYTDAIDNAGGVDCSDHEVNIKILLNEVFAAGDLTEKQRNELLAEMTNEVALLVLTNNRSQTQALSTARVEAASMVDVHARYLADLEARGLLNCDLERLPDAEAMAERRQEGAGLTTPELAVLLAYTKNTLNADLLASSVPDDDAFLPLLMAYFPEPLQVGYAAQAEAHQLRRQIVATRISNLVVDRGGTSMVYRLSKETSAPTQEIAAAHIAAWEIFQLDDLNLAVDGLETVLAADRQSIIRLSTRQLAERATRLLVRNRPLPFNTASAIADLAAPVQEAVQHIPEYLAGADRLSFENRTEQLLAAGVPQELALEVAALPESLAALDIVEVASQSGSPVPTVTGVHFAIADSLELNWLRDQILALPRDSQWSSLARLTLRGDLYGEHRALTREVCGRSMDADPNELMSEWLATHPNAVSQYRRTISEIRSTGLGDLTTVLVAAREVRTLIARTSSAGS